jgi:uncharacterized protein YlzI (FlbEa/FlbD family)
LRLCHARYLDGPGTRVVQCGPLEFWAFPECRKVRELFDRDDEIIHSSLRSSGEVLIRRNGRLLVVNSESAETIGELPDVPGARRFAMAPGKKQVVIEDGRDVHLYEFGEHAPRWTAPMLWLRDPEDDTVAAGLVTVSKRNPTNPGSGLGSGVLRLDTGELDSRFDHLGRLGRICLAPNGRFAIVTVMGSITMRKPGSAFVCDLETGQVLWTLSGLAGWNQPIFEAEGDEVLGFEMSPDKQIQAARWRSRDGGPLPAGRSRSLWQLRQQSSDGRFTLRAAVIGSNSLVDRLINNFNQVASKYRTGYFISPLRQVPALMETETGQVIGPLPDHSTGVTHMFLPDRSALVSAGPGAVYYYELPPHRDSWWLAGWGIVPPLALMGFVKAVKSVTQHRRSQSPPKGSPTGFPSDGAGDSRLQAS